MFLLQPFVEKSRANSLLYRQKLADWEKKMTAQGHTDLLSQGAYKRMTNKRTIRKPRAAKNTVLLTGSVKASSKTEGNTTKKYAVKKESGDGAAGKKNAAAKPSSTKSSKSNKHDDSDSD